MLLINDNGGRIMLNQPATDSHPDLWVGLVTVLPWALLYLRGFVAELGKSSAQALWKMMARRQQAQRQAPTIIIFIVVSEGGDHYEPD